MSKKFFSVIIPTYNRLDFLKKSIDSVLNQSFKEFEFLIIDDGSSDGTVEYLDSRSIKYLTISKRDAPQGVSRARNHGIENTSAPWVCFLDSDDQWLPSKLERQFEFIKEFPGFQINHTQERWIRNELRVNQMKKHVKGGGDQFERCLELCVISPSTVCLKRELLQKWRGFREDYLVCEDYDLWLKICATEKVGFIDEELIEKYGGHEDQLSRKFFAMDYYRVKSIKWILEHLDLSEDQRVLAKGVLIKKAEILLKGYKKHNNLDNYDEISYILNSVMGV